MESINIADRDMLFWAGSPNEFNDGNSNDFIVNEDVIVKSIKKYRGPYLNAQKFWLGNRDKTKWQEDPHHSRDGSCKPQVE